jgi:hypothetical protein
MNPQTSGAVDVVQRFNDALKDDEGRLDPCRK